MTKYNLKDLGEKEAKYRTLVNPELMDRMKDRIVEIIVVGQKFKDKDYSATQLAKDLNTNSRYISAVINDRFHCNYSTLVNGYRIQEARSILTDKRYSHLTVEKVSAMVGFNNRQSFYTAFYKVMGMTPRQYKLARMANR